MDTQLAPVLKKHEILEQWTERDRVHPPTTQIRPDLLDVRTTRARGSAPISASSTPVGSRSRRYPTQENEGHVVDCGEIGRRGREVVETVIAEREPVRWPR